MSMPEFDQLMAEGLNLDVEAYWGAGFLPGRFRSEDPSWSYKAIARAVLAKAESALDMGTGEGGVLASLAPLPKLTVAYEEWWPTVPTAWHDHRRAARGATSNELHRHRRTHRLCAQPAVGV